MSTAAVAAAAAGVLALAVFVLWVRARRQVIRRVGAVVARLDERPVGVDGGGGNLESALSRLERTADRSNTTLHDTRAASERLAAAIQGLPHGVVVVDETGRVVLRNRAAEDFVGARHGDALAEEAVNELLGAALRGVEGARDLQLFGPPKRALALRAAPLEGGGARGAVAFVQDVSTVRKVDSVRRDFVANVSHELKTPIGALVALAEALEADDDPDVMRRLSQRVRHEAERLGRIVDDLLDLSLIEAQEAPERDLVAVRTLVDEAVDRIRGAAEGAGVAIDVGEVPASAVVSCDRRQVVSALFNLLDNAVKYSTVDETRPGDRVEVSVGAGDGAVVIAVRDHGIGIPERDRERIFERFYRVDRARSRDSGGTGLGLAIVRHVAQAHGGTVSVESTEGEGSVFTLSLPLAGAVATGGDREALAP